MPFVKGQSGNPGGRPKVVGDVQTLARERTTAAISALTEIVEDRQAPPAARVSAATALLDRGYGKPPQSNTVTISQKDIKQLTDDELMPIAAAALKEGE